MQLEEELARFSPEKDTLLTIGVFDGVHLGHKQLVARLVTEAKKQDLSPGVITFRQHPQELISPQSSLPFLTSIEERTALLMAEGVKLVVPLSFTPELSSLSAREFVERLQAYLRMRGLVIGPDFALGKSRKGDAAALRRLGREMGFSVTTVPPAVIDGEIVSSTLIRKALADGNVKKAYKLMVRPFSLHGGVIKGVGRGTGLGFPTANLDTNSHQAMPADGVYAAWAYVGNEKHRSLVNVGRCPTFGGIERHVEVYVIDYHGDLYGRELKVDFVDRLREERQFGNVDELKRQMAEDARRGKTILGSDD